VMKSAEAISFTDSFLRDMGIDLFSLQGCIPCGCPW
jgi:hypothetical protein